MSYIVLDALRALKEAVLAKLAANTKPLRVTVYTNGTGMHNILPESSYQIITLVGGGGKGGDGYNVSGSVAGGAPGNSGEELHRRVNLSGAVPYEVGAPNGGKTTLGLFFARGGYQGGNGSSIGWPSSTAVSARDEFGVTPSRPGSSRGGDSNMGMGGLNGTQTKASEPGKGYGGGGGGGGTGLAYLAGSNGSGGYIRIEEY